MLPIPTGAICRSHPQFIDVYSRHIISGVVMNQVTTGAPAPCGLIAVYFAIESTRRELKHWNAVPLACVVYCYVSNMFAQLAPLFLHYADSTCHRPN